MTAEADALFDRGHAAAARGNLEEAIGCFRAVVAMTPADADAHSNLGALLQERGDLDAAAASFERALALRPDHAEAHNNLAALLEELGRRAEAIGHYRRALELAPRSARIAYNLALAHLRAFEFEAGWQLHDARFDTDPPVTPRRPFPVPELSAADLGQGLKTAIWSEQGLGDQVLYATLLPELEARGERFVLEVDPRLVTAFRRAHPDWEVSASLDLTSCERHLAVGSLPQLLRPSVESFARQPRALLGADPQRTAALRSRVARDGVRVIGISWKSFLRAWKSAALSLFLSLSRRADVRLLDLQYGDTAAERAEFAAMGGHLEHLPDLDLFADVDGVLAAIEACDLVVTTSNVTAHFAGALGKETHVLAPGNRPLYYWMPGPDGRSLWYPSVRVVSAGTWRDAERLIEALPAPR